MHYTTFHSTSILKRFSPLLIGLTLLCSYLFGGTTEAFAVNMPGGNVSDPVVRAVDIAKPAVVRILTEVDGHLTVHFSATQSATFPQNTDDTYKIQLSGTGTFISAHGDILTADHVVNPPHDKALDQALATRAAKDIADYMNKNVKSAPGPVTDDQVAKTLQSGQLASKTDYGKPVSEAFLSTDYTGPLSATTLDTVPNSIRAHIDKIEKESASTQKDVAIVHVPMSNTPSVQLGDSSSVQQQDTLTIVGFPGNGDINTLPTDIFTSSVNKITVSSIKVTDTGAPVIQVGGNVEHGDSGGPALDDKGGIVGIVSFNITGSNSPGETSFFQASNSANDLIRALNLDTTPGPLQKSWSQAFTNYASNQSGHWHQADQQFSSIANTYPQFKAIGPYQTYIHQQAQSERVNSNQSTHNQKSIPNAPTSSNRSLYILAGGVIALLVLLLLFFIVRSRGRRKRQRHSKPDLSASSMAISLNPAIENSKIKFGNASQSQPAKSQQHVGAFGEPAQGQNGNSHKAGNNSHSQQGILPIRQPSTSNQTGVQSTSTTHELHPWPCGHMNRNNARFCSICGEPSPVMRSSPPRPLFER